MKCSLWDTQPTNSTQNLAENRDKERQSTELDFLANIYINLVTARPRIYHHRAVNDGYKRGERELSTEN